MNRPVIDKNIAIEYLRLDKIENAVISDYLIEQLCFLLNTGLYHAPIITDQIRSIQGNIKTKVEDPRDFLCPILHGLSYCHWFEMKLIGKNMINYWDLDSQTSRHFLENAAIASLNKCGLKENNLFNSKAANDPKKIKHAVKYSGVLANHAVNECLKSKLTGERIIFFKNNGSNIFLTLALHEETDEEVFLRIAANCGNEHPSISHLIIDEKINLCKENIKKNTTIFPRFHKIIAIKHKEIF